MHLLSVVSPNEAAAVVRGIRSYGRPLPREVREVVEDCFAESFRDVLICDTPAAHFAARCLGARAFTAGGRIVCATRCDLEDLRLLAHELAHVVQGRRPPRDAALLRVEPVGSLAEIEAERAADQVVRGAAVGPLSGAVNGLACTNVSSAIENLISYSWNDWAVTSAEERQVLTLLRGDPMPTATVQDLQRRGAIPNLISRIDGDERLQLAQLLGGRIDQPTAVAIRQSLVFYPRSNHDVPDNSHIFLFDVSNDLQNRFRALGVVHPAPPFNSGSVAGVIGRTPTAPFGGSGATGVSPRNHSTIPVADQWRMFRGNAAVRATYDNPLGPLSTYLAALTPTQRRQQAEALLRQPIVSLVPYSYAGRIPSRAQVMEAAASAHNLHPALVAAFILAEQRDQSANEDAKDYQAAISILQQNTSIGLGQIVISTARRHDLFADLLSPGLRGRLDHVQIAMLLTSDEFNIFAAARYLRITANLGAGIPAARLPRTVAAFPGLDMPAYGRNSRTWPDANIAALGAEYTSTPWDDRVTPWGDFVLEAYRDVAGSGVF